MRICGPRRRLWMELHAAPRLFFVRDAFIGAVIGVGKPRLPITGKRRFIHGKAMVLRGDVTTIRFSIDTRHVLAAVTVGEFVGFCASSQCKELVSEAHAD